MIKGTYSVRWCDGSRDNIRSPRAAMKLARAMSSKRFATDTCGPGSHVVRAVTAKTAVAVAECKERSCTPFKTMATWPYRDPNPWTRAKATAAFKQRRGLSGGRKKRRR